MAGVSFDQIRTCGSHDLVSLYNDIEDDSEESDSPFQYGNIDCDYFEPGQFNAKYQDGNKYISYFQLNSPVSLQIGIHFEI